MDGPRTRTIRADRAHNSVCGRYKPRVLFAALCTAALQAAPAATPPSETLTGEWNGARSRLHDRGIDLSLGYTSEIATNPSGGDRQRTRYTDQWAFGTQFDLEKLLGWKAARFHITITDRNGRNLGDDADLGTLQLVQEVYGRGQTSRLTQFWYGQSWRDGMLDWKFGRVTVGEDFASFSCEFQNLTFCGSQPGNVRGEYWYNWPVSQWGTRLKLQPNPRMYLQLGIYQVNPRYIDDAWATRQGLYPNNPSGTTGALIPLEFAWLPALNGLPGSYKFGAWLDSSNASDVYLDVDRQPIVLTGGAPLQRDSRYGAYINFEQQVSGAAGGQGAHLFLNITQSDRATAASMDRQIAFGMQYKGASTARPRDVIGVAIGSNHVNGRVADARRLGNALGNDALPVPGSEWVAELYYGWVMLPFLTMRPNVQFVQQPGGIRSRDDVVVIGLKTSIVF